MTDIRVFISIEIPDKTSLDGPLSYLGGIKGVRTSPAEQIHITLRFIGDIDESKVDTVEDCVRRAVSGIGPFNIKVSGAGAFPKRERPSVVWIGASPQREMAAIADRIGDNLRRAGIDFDGKPFKSHITVGRCRGPADLSGFFERFSGSDFTEFQCDEILVMRSVLGPSGAKHTVLRRIPLS